MKKAKVKVKKFSVSLFLFLSLNLDLAYAGELEETRYQLQVVQASMEVERQRYLAAKAEMERSSVVGEYLLPALKKREGELIQKLEALEAKLKADSEAKARADKEAKK